MQGAQGPGWHPAWQGWGHPALLFPHTASQVWGMRKGLVSGWRVLPQKHTSEGTCEVCVWQPGQRQEPLGEPPPPTPPPPPPPPLPPPLAAPSASCAGARRRSPAPPLEAPPLAALVDAASSEMSPRLLPRQVSTQLRWSTQKQVEQDHTASSLRTGPMHTMHSRVSLRSSAAMPSLRPLSPEPCICEPASGSRGLFFLRPAGKRPEGVAPLRGRTTLACFSAPPSGFGGCRSCCCCCCCCLRRRTASRKEVPTADTGAAAGKGAEEGGLALLAPPAPLLVWFAGGERTVPTAVPVRGRAAAGKGPRCCCCWSAACCCWSVSCCC